MSFTWLTSGRFLNTFISIHIATTAIHATISHKIIAPKIFQKENLFFQDIFCAHSDRFFELAFSCLYANRVRGVAIIIFLQRINVKCNVNLFYIFSSYKNK